LLNLAPHVVERRAPTPHELEYLRTLDVALEGFRKLRAGSAGLFTLSPTAIGDDGEDMFLGRSRVWKTVTPYIVTRHAKGGVATEALAADILAECRRLELPEPRVEASNVRGVPGMGLTGDVTLIFEQSVAAPIMLGRTRYLGGGLFRPDQESSP
jgi:CRISPR-associated protein Csb2